MTVRLLQYSDLETALDDPHRAGALAGAIETHNGPDALVLGSGDNTAPGALSLATRGRAALTFFRALTPTADTFGNHDFDFGPQTACELAADAPQTWLCANAEDDDGRFAADATKPSTLVDVEGGTVGVIGVSHPETARMNPAAAGVQFTDPVPAIREQEGDLRERGADYVVVISHCGKHDAQLARETDVDAVLGGHVHDVYAEVIAGTPVVRPGRDGRYFAEVRLGSKAAVTIHEVAGHTTDTQHIDTDLVEELETMLEAHGLDEVVTTVDVPLERTEAAVTEAGSPIGCLVADALRWKTGADVALSPPGAIRSGEPLVGEVTAAELAGLVPYDDRLDVVELSGERLREAFVAVPFGYHDDGHPDRHCSHVSGVRLVWDDAAGELETVTVGGDPIDPDRRYTVAVADYLVQTDHVNDAFDTSDVVQTYGIARHAVVEYAREVGLQPPEEMRILRPTLS